MNVLRRRRYPRPPQPSREEKQRAWDLFEHGSEAEMTEYIAAETEKIQAKWDAIDRLRRLGITADMERHVEIVDFTSGMARRHVQQAEY